MSIDPRVIAGSSGNDPTPFILTAQQASLNRDERMSTLVLHSLIRSVPQLPVAEVVTRAEVTLTIDGASTIEIDLRDPNQWVERSGILDPDSNGRLNTVLVVIDGLRFRLAAARRRSFETLTLVFEDEAMAMLDDYSGPVHVSRNKLTRAQFIGALIAEVTDWPLIYIAPQENVRQVIKHPDLPTAHVRGSGFNAGTTFKVKGQKADAGQMHNAAVALTVADQAPGITDRSRLALLVAAIGESGLRDIPNQGGSGYTGVWQAAKSLHLSTEQQAGYFLTGGQGFQGGGAIKLAHDHPDWSAGHIAYTVEGDRSNFTSDAAAEHFYQQWHAEAKAILSAWQGTSGPSSQVTTYKSFEFTRGLPGQKETSRQAATRLAQDVNWRFFAIGSVVSFVSDDWLISRPAELILDAQDTDGNWRVPPGLLSMPTYDVDHGKLAQNVTLLAVADSWGVIPGQVVVLRNMGTITGRWIVDSFNFNLCDPTAAQVTLTKPLPPLLEAAPDQITVGAGSSTASGGAAAAVAWARSKIGHYKEEWGQNLGGELNRLEGEFGLKGQEWCAIFATTAAVKGGAAREVRTPAVANIRAWATAGTHGYERGVKSRPQPGDLMMFGTAHVGVVEKVSATGVVTIEGNTSAGQVSRVDRLPDSGDYARPVYPA